MVKENKMFTGAHILLECLNRCGVTDIFGYPGGTVIPIYDAIYKYDNITHRLARHEQGAAHEADGYARSTGKVGVCLATSGPGATNTVSGIMTAYMDSTPMLIITGQVGMSLLGKDAFQESDIVGITIPITKNNYMITDIRQIPNIVQEAHYLASTGRPGPVLIDIPKNVQTETITEEEFEELYKKGYNVEGYDPTFKGHPGQIKRAASFISEAKKPVILAGNGILNSGAEAEVRELAEKANIPVVTTLLGIGSFPGNHELNYGMLGMHGCVAANYITDQADLLIACGMRFDDRVTGDVSKFSTGSKVIHIDIDPAEIGKNVKVDVPIVGDLKTVLKELNAIVEPKKHDEWLAQCNDWEKEFPISVPAFEEDKLTPQYVLSELNKILEGKAIVATDVGQHQMWAAQFLQFNEPRTFLSSGGAGTMGFGLPAAIGAQVANPDKKVISISGDGGFQMTMQELMLLVEHKLPIKVIILNNSFLGMVRQWQDLFYDKRYSYVDLEFNPDFEKIGEAYGIKSVRMSNKKELDDQLADLIKSDEPVLMNIIIKKEENVFPMIPGGLSVQDMVGKRGVVE